MVGILVHGNNHFILSGPVPDEAAALAKTVSQKGFTPWSANRWG
jgi:hypothetical protein